MADFKPKNGSLLDPESLKLTPERRIRELKQLFETDDGKEQCVNIDTLIRMYESGELVPPKFGDPSIYLIDGKAVDEDEFYRTPPNPGSLRMRENQLVQEQLRQIFPPDSRHHLKVQGTWMCPDPLDVPDPGMDRIVNAM